MVSRCQLLILCFSASLYVASALSPDGLTLLSLLSHWTSVLPSINSSWKSSDSIPCSWVGILCDHDGNVVSLNLAASGIFGQLGPEIGRLNHLQTLVLVTNGFSGTIPPELGNCSLLEYINLSENSFSGQIPYALKNLQKLQYMSFSSNLLTGEIPESLFQIPRLEEVYLYNNSISGPIPSNIGNATELLKLYVSSNQLSGTIPSFIGNCSKLEALFLNHNRLNGVLPQSLNSLENLVYLDVKNNTLGGTISLGSGSCEKLFILDLSFNVFGGGIPSGLGNCSSLAEFAAVNSNLVGSIPSSLGLLHELSILRLPENHLYGKIPPEIGNCKSLKALHLYSNELEGEIPNELGRLSKLRDLGLYFNHLTGEIPLSIWKIQSLEHILLHNNSLSGELPSQMTELRHLKNISLFDNQFSGVIPHSLGINSSIVKLDLMNNKFTGNIPPNLCFRKQLRVLNIALNQLQGGIPHDVGRCATLGRLVVKENNLSGSLPEFEINLNLKYMDISKNNISGGIPPSLGNCTSLTGLILSNNIIRGIIPPELGNLVNLQVLNLAHNNLHGPLPQQLSHCTKMEIFDVGFNFLNGLLPPSLRSWTGLTTLILRENHFSGVIPSFLSEFDQLLELQLGGNMFGGKIPPSVGAMQNLLYGLNLSANGFIGEVPLEIGKLKKLQSLDISLNNLTGSINVLSELSSLIEINISYNSFAGPVPEKLMQYLNFSLSSFLGNPSLCVHCSRSDVWSCSKTSYLKPCDYESTNHKGTKLLILFMVLGFIVLIVCLLGILVIYIHHFGRRSKEDNFANYEKREPWYLNDKQNRRTNLKYMQKVMRATENLSDRYRIGQGGQGIVYKAELDFEVFAVKKVEVARSKRKKLSMTREIEVMRKIRHQNVAQFLGSWIGEDYGLIFYKYMENGSLHDVLHENDPSTCLDWDVRYKIAVGVAKGLAYLHHGCDPPILHRDIKPKNILLDSAMNPYITDFGIAIALNQSSTINLRSTYHLGTRGFMAPEIAYTAVPNCQSDVYSYGVVLLELITRKKVLDSSFDEKGTTLVKWFKSVWRETREIEEIVDSSLASELSHFNVVVQVFKVLFVALICIKTDPKHRPQMRDVIKIYEASTVQGIYDRNYRTFHLGRTLAAAAESGFDQLFLVQEEENNIPAKEGSLPRIQEVMEATENLNDRYIIGRGAHGVVYKVGLDPDRVYAVKKLSFARSEYNSLSMAREIQTLGQIRHRNLVKLETFWLRETYCLILYNYMPNGSLHDVLHENNPSPSVAWNVRYEIALGTAHGLAYLHYDCEPPIVHCDIKPKNILLDSDVKPHIADFGMAKILDQSSASTSSITVRGTVGYIAPEYAYTTANNRESDVYSYGVVLLELITRKNPLDRSFTEGIDMVNWVRTLWGETGNIDKIVDSSLAEEFLDSNVLEKVIYVLMVALRCTEMDPRMRPTMRDVIKQLEDANPRTRSRKSQLFFSLQKLRSSNFLMHI